MDAGWEIWRFGEIASLVEHNGWLCIFPRAELTKLRLVGLEARRLSVRSQGLFCDEWVRCVQVLLDLNHLLRGQCITGVQRHVAGDCLSSFRLIKVE